MSLSIPKVSNVYWEKSLSSQPILPEYVRIRISVKGLQSLDSKCSLTLDGQNRPPPSAHVPVMKKRLNSVKNAESLRDRFACDVISVSRDLVGIFWWTLIICGAASASHIDDDKASTTYPRRHHVFNMWLLKRDGSGVASYRILLRVVDSY
ncbi:hypothetical protein J6590_001993 [Homalodisca vitripennis]|nr:hypothetical protein J6590_001993 [Homalodisca vitripennis]